MTTAFRLAKNVRLSDSSLTSSLEMTDRFHARTLRSRERKIENKNNMWDVSTHAKIRDLFQGDDGMIILPVRLYN